MTDETPSAPGAESAAVDDDALRPLDVDGVGAVAVGTVVWAVAFVVCLLLQSRLDAAGNGWWTWTCAVGALLGLPGLWYVRRRRDAYRRAKAAEASAA